MDPSQLLRSVGQAALVALAAVLVARMVRPVLAGRRHRAVPIAAVLIPWFTPALLTGYAWTGAALALTRVPGLAATFYGLILVLKFAPAAILALHLIRPPVTREALHCHKLAVSPGARFLRHAAFVLRSGALVPSVAAFLLVFLFAFPEFELASLFSLPSWTVTVFDAHAGGIPVTHSVRLILVPLAAQALLIAAAIAVAAGGRFRQEEDPGISEHPSACRRAAAIAYLAAAAAVVTLIPFCLVVRDTIRGIALLAQTFPLAAEVGVSLACAALAAIASVWWCTLFHRRPVVATLGLVGLSGPLTLSLATAWLLSHRPFLFLRETHVPLVAVLAILALPVAFVAVRLATGRDRLAALHAAVLLRPQRASSWLIWELRARAPFWTAVLLFTWIYWDLTASSILSPIGVAPVSVRLYNLMHYGHTSALSGMILLALLAPIAAVAIAYFAGRFIHNAWHEHG